MKTRANAKTSSPDLPSKPGAYSRGNHTLRRHGVARCGEFVIVLPDEQ
jgi:hypothetical protein